MINLLYILLLSIPISSIKANSYGSNLPIPRFASIKSNKVNARRGPLIKSPIEWVFVKKGEPIEIIAEYEQWRQIKDIKGDTGWVHSSVLSGKRSVVILGTKPVLLTKEDDIKSKIIANILPDVRCELKICKGGYCKIRCLAITKYYQGWVEQKYLWGIYNNLNDQY
jgi:SH3-like domain-containing protein